MNNFSAPLISVIIPTYNHSNYLSRALQSVCDQTYFNWEAIVIDNNSTDDTNTVIGSFTDKRIRSLKINNNGIIAASRNMGIRAAKGEWIAFLDSDDWWSLDKLEACSIYMNDNVDLIYHNLDIIYDLPSFFKKRKSSRKIKPPVLKNLLFKGNPITNSGVIVRKKLLLKVGGISEDAEMVAAEDYNTWLKIAAITDAFKYIPKSLGGNLVHAEGISQRDMSKPHRHAINAFSSSLTRHELSYVEKEINYIAGKYKYLQKDYPAAWMALKQALSFRKLFLSLKVIYMLIMIIMYS